MESKQCPNCKIELPNRTIFMTPHKYMCNCSEVYYYDEMPTDWKKAAEGKIVK